MTTLRITVQSAVVALAAGLAAASALAQPYDTPPAPAAPRPLQIATPADQRLPNGLRVIVAERHGVPLVSARLVVLAGAEADPPQRAGLASMTAGLLARGTTRRSAPAVASAAEALGGSIESAAGWNQSYVGTTVTRPKLSAALALLAEVALKPAFAAAEVERYRVQALDDMKVAYSQPGTVAGLAAQRALYGAGAYGHPAGGTPASLPRITRADLQRAHAAAYRPDNAVLVLAGDITLDEAVALARTHFGAWKAPAQQVAAVAPAAVRPWPAGTVVIDMPGAGQAGVALALPAIPAASAERFDAEVTNAVLGMGYSSRLNQEIRIKRGLSYGARSDADLRQQAGALRVAVQTKNPSAAEVAGLIGIELDRLIKAPVPAAELAARKASLIGGFSRSLETTQGLADEVAALAVVGLPLADLTQRIQNLDAVAPEQVQAFAARYFMPQQRRVVVAGVASEFLPALKAQVGTLPVLPVLPVQSLDLESAQAPAAP
jgi:zinc protease